MATLIFRTLKSSNSVRRFASRKALCVLAAVAALICLGILVAENDAEQVDSGWAIAPTPTIAKGSKHAHPKHQIILNDVLRHSQTPLLSTPPAQPVAAAKANETNTANTTTATKGGVRFAVRPDGVEGWRPANHPFSPLNGQLGQQAASPQLIAPHTEPAAADAPTEPAPANTAEPETLEESCGEESRGDSRFIAPQTPTAEDTAPATQPDEITPIEISPEDAEPTDAGSDATKSRRDKTLNVGPIENNASENNSAASDDSQPLPPKVTTTPPPPLTKQLMSLRTRLRNVLKGYYRKQLNSRDNDPWEVMHGMLAYGVHSRIRQGGPRGEPVTSVGWLCYNKPCKNLNLLYVSPKGEVRAKYGVGLQGHLGQLLAMLAQCRVSEEYPIRVGKRQFTIKDLIESEKKTCYPKSELTFKLIAFQYYVDLNDEWENDQGVAFDIPRVIREELAQPIRGAACGGTHRLSSLSLTVKTRVRRGEPLDGDYARAADFVERYHQYAFKLQNRDGSLSTNWFRGRGDDSDINRRIKTTGHILEWLCYSLSDEELRQPKTIAAVTYLTNLMYSNYDNEWEVGPMSHATHALLLYDERVFQPFDAADHTATYKPKRRPATSSRPAAPSASRR
jgi:hypothetical protein